MKKTKIEEEKCEKQEKLFKKRCKTHKNGEKMPKISQNTAQASKTDAAKVQWTSKTEVAKVQQQSNADVEKLQQDGNLSVKQKVLLCVCGALLGFVNGFFGSGGGMLCVPILEKVLHLPTKYSHATAIAIILPISFVSAAVYILNGNLRAVPFFTISAGVVAGGILGAFLLKFLPSKIVRIVFVAIMLAGGIRLFF